MQFDRKFWNKKYRFADKAPKYQSDEMKEYLKTDELWTSEKKLLFKMMSRIYPNKTNFKNSHGGNLSCILCKDPSSVESEIHLLSCEYLLNDTQLAGEIKKIEYDDIFRTLPKQILAVRVWTKIFKIYNEQVERMKKWKDNI